MLFRVHLYISGFILVQLQQYSIAIWQATVSYVTRFWKQLLPKLVKALASLVMVVSNAFLYRFTMCLCPDDENVHKTRMEAG